jgi:hypothetical protein
MDECIHLEVTCINPYEIIRKYKCNSCGEVMMCACEEEFARRFFPHQLKYGKDLKTQKKISVTIGFQKKICNTCRGLPEEAYPKAETYGRGSKILRYYWREILCETTKRFGDWADSKNYKDYYLARKENPEVFSKLRKEVIEEIKKLHEYSPKYNYQEKSQKQVLEENNVEVVKFEGVHIKGSGRKVGILEGTEILSPEDFVSNYFKKHGYNVIVAESVPFHVIFGIFMWLLIQDCKDPLVRIVGFGDRKAADERRKEKEIWTHLPQDFGTPGYAKRRSEAIIEHLHLIDSENDILWLFDYWLESSEGLRQYLWAHRDADIARARRIVSILPKDDLIKILKYLIADYWRRYTGWPDLIVYNKKEFFMVEVKSSKDRLREDQKNWIYGNSNELHFPFKIAKIHKKVN